ncbi:protein fluG [Lophiotrema nucula]|uniref:Glutamine synthetase n=1 Tax=Lophiotrema nucula TaxID=690887 RepID=A0A6A5YHR1_9PLEO|nr:protein fluG [Lophiotrema nucula]
MEDNIGHFLAENTVDYFRFQWVDHSGVAHAKVIPKTHCLSLAASDGTLSIAQNCLIVPIATAPECYPAGPERWTLHPDWNSLRVCGFRPNHALVMCFLNRAEPHCGVEFGRCPRMALQRALDAFGDKAQILLGYEIEFVLLNEESELVKPLDRVTGYANMAGLRGVGMLIMEDICTALDRSGILVHDFQTEVPDHLEITLQPMSPMQAIDSPILAQEAIRTLAISHNVKASLAPRPVFNGPQSGLHAHFSLNPSPENINFFLQGLLENIKSLCAFGMPHVDSYLRVVDDGAGCFIEWGTENRDMPIRRVTDDHWELRISDATANQYLFMAAVISAGIEGMEIGAQLRYKDCMEFQENLTKEKLATLGMSEEMPKCLEETILAAKHSKVLLRRMGEELLAEYVKVKEKEVEKFRGVPDNDRRKKYLAIF